MINGVEVNDVTVDDFIDTRDSRTLWFWPNGYGVAPAFELNIEQVEDMYKSLWACETMSQDSDDVEIKVTLKRQSN